MKSACVILLCVCFSQLQAEKLQDYFKVTKSVEKCSTYCNAGSFLNQDVCEKWEETYESKCFLGCYVVDSELVLPNYITGTFDNNYKLMETNFKGDKSVKDSIQFVKNMNNDPNLVNFDEPYSRNFYIFNEIAKFRRCNN